jgi:SH3-like domain-containing protein
MVRLRVIVSCLLCTLVLPILPVRPAWGQSNLGTASGQGTLQPPRATVPTVPRAGTAPGLTPPTVAAPTAPPGAPPAGQTLSVPPRLRGQEARPAPRLPVTNTPATRTPPRPGQPPPARTATPARPNATRPNAVRPRAAAGAAAAGAAIAIAPPATPAPAGPPEDVGSVTGLPMPRFVALRADEVNLRVGPDTRFPIDWTYQRRDLPVEVVREYSQWRRIRDMDGTEGWVHQSTLSARRTMIVRGQEQDLRRSESETSATVAKLQPGVVGRIRRCAAGNAWCEVQVGDLRGYLRRTDFWGVKPDEEIN